MMKGVPGTELPEQRGVVLGFMKKKGLVAHLLSVFLEIKRHSMTGIDPRHKPHHLSLLPSGPDEVRGGLLRGDRSE